MRTPSVVEMSGDVQVFEETVDQNLQRSGPAPWAWLLIGLAVGLGAGVVFLAPALVPTETTSAVSVEETAPAIPGAPSEENGIADIVADFPDALVGLAQTQLSSYEYVLWPYASDVLTRGLPISSSGQATIDSSGTWVASTMELPEPGGVMLSMGQVGNLNPVATGVSSNVWHDSREGVLGYTADQEGATGLWVTSLVTGPDLILALPQGARLAAWGDWGYAVFGAAGQRFDLLTTNGELKTIVEGVPVASHRSGWILVVDDGTAMLVSSGGGVRVIPDFPRVEGESLAGAISPDGQRVAVLGSNGLAVGSVDGSEKSVLINTGFRSNQVSWSSDSRFVMAPANRGVTVFDTVSMEAESVLGDLLLSWVGVIPLTPAS